ncbi:hypothetical protein CCICO_10505 [Corynebacterium ciconiae DSM 44920]|uniref:hypothetical protein n=1 Tax=Corynebacterium ciconiae TaxID=227319 RepID=UPI000365991C|nr:hypothetical protein [Corynebacterium ciconiae]WKD62100.1 hypothetical protein CCICO_10505 [Corynebacterium ciconiae DSM 44920]
MWLGYLLSAALNALLHLPLLLRLMWRNRTSRTPLPQHPEVIITLTSHGRRLRWVHLAIESVAHAGPVELWLEPRDYAAPRPAGLQRLCDRGLRIRKAEPGLGPHTKYLPAARAHPGRWLITIDDDVLYLPWCVPRLIDAARPHHITAHRAHRIRLNNQRIAPYSQWRPVRSTDASLLHVATGVSAVCYPPRFVHTLAQLSRQDLGASLRCDDLFLHHAALRAGLPVAQVRPRPAHFPLLPSAAWRPLVRSNLSRGNDAAIAQLYSVEDVQQLGRALG